MKLTLLQLFFPDLEKLKNELLKRLGEIDQRQGILKQIILDKDSDKNIVTSDHEFDDANVDPRYESKSYNALVYDKERNNLPSNQTVLKRAPTGLYKGSKVNYLSESSKNEEIHRKKIEKSLQDQKKRNKRMRASSDTAVAISELNKSLQKSRELLQQFEERERERFERAQSMPFRAGFDYMNIPENYNEDVKSNKSDFTNPTEYDKRKDPAYDIYSKMYISKRYIPESVLKDQISDTPTLRLPELFAKLPQYIQQLRDMNFIVVGVVTRKNIGYTNNGRSKYIKMQISNFHTDIMLLLYDEAQQKHFKVHTGSLIAIMNPEILDANYQRYDKKKGSYSYFMLKVASHTSIIEYARARDVGTCLGNGKTPCKQLVNLRESRYCPTHQEQKIDRNASNRNEMGSNYRTFAPVDEKGNKQVMVVTERQIQAYDLAQSHSVKASGLAIEKAPKNVPLAPGKFANKMVVTDFSNPITIENMKTKEEKNRHHFTSFSASNAFLNDAVNKNALRKQEEQHEIDQKLLKKKMDIDVSLKRKHQKSLEALEMKKRLKVQSLERMRTLSQATKTEKSLRKDKKLVEKLKKERHEIQKHVDLVKVKKTDVDVANTTNRIVINTTAHEVTLSSDEDSDLEIDM